MLGHIDSHQVHWYAWGNISAFISAVFTLYNQTLAFLPVMPRLAAGLCVPYLHFSLCLCQIQLCFIGTAIRKYSVAKAVRYKGYNVRMMIENTIKKTTNDLYYIMYTTTHYTTLFTLQHTYLFIFGYENYNALFSNANILSVKHIFCVRNHPPIRYSL